MKSLLISLFGKSTFRAVNGCELSLRNECIYNESMSCVFQPYSETTIKGEEDGTISVKIGSYTYGFGA